MRRTTLSLGALCALVWIIAGGLLTKSPDVRFPLIVGETYDVAISDNVARFDLPPSRTGEQYLLVVGNLSSDVAARRVSVTSERTQRVERVPFSRVRELRPQRLAAAIPTCAVGSRPPSARERQFWLPVTGGSSRNPASYRRIEGKLTAEGKHIRVYVDRDDRVEEEAARALIRLCEDEVRPRTVRHIGWPADVDVDGKLAILMTSWLGRLEGGRVSLGGMVRPADFRSDDEMPYSNRADVLYLNSSLRAGRHLESLLAHELAHAVTCSGRRASDSWWYDAGDEEAWLNEAIAHVAEDLQSDNRSNLDYRLAGFLARPGAAPLVIGDYRDAGLWRDARARGACYSFLRFCVERYGTRLLPKLIYSPYQGKENLEAATGNSFDELFRHWTIASFLDARNVRAGAMKSASVNEDLCPLDIAEPLGDWGLAGPRFRTLVAGHKNTATVQFDVRGTSAGYVLIAADSRGSRRFTIRGETNARLQVSLVRMPDHMAQLELEVVLDASGGRRLRLSERTGQQVRLTHVFWQSLDNTQDSRQRHHCLRADELSEVFDSTVVPSGGTLESRAVRLPGAVQGPIMVCAAGVDVTGHRVAAWREIGSTVDDVHLALVEKGAVPTWRFATRE